MRCRVAAAVAALAAFSAVTAACSGPAPAPARQATRHAAPPRVSDASAGNRTCTASPPVTPLPDWARSGFSPPGQSVPHVLGASGDIVAILWALTDALASPPRRAVRNKILWVSRLPRDGSPLRIRARLAGSGRTVYRQVRGGPGPSDVNLPAPGCWDLTLTWSGHTDHLDLRYVAS